MTRKRKTPWAWIVLAVVLVGGTGLIGLIFIALALGGASGPHVGMITFAGEIAGTDSRGFFGPTGPSAFIEDCDTARRDKSVKAVVVRINSPGGSAAASEEMYQAIRRLRAVKPVVCSMGDVAASGGYYMASGCNKIYANPATITASIGVISQFVNMQSLFNKLGVNADTLKSGKFKDAGSPFRKLRPEERQLFQAMIMDIYNGFVDDVVDGRKEATKGKLTRAKLLKIADGRVVTGRQAKKLLLVDEVGGLRDAIKDAANMGGLSTVKVREVQSGGFSSMLNADDSTSARGFGAQIGAGFNEMMSAAGSAFARGFAETFQQEMREGTSSTQVAPQAR